MDFVLLVVGEYPVHNPAVLGQRRMFRILV